MATPYLIVDRAEQAIEHYKRAFGAKERTRVETRTGKIAHAELEIGDSIVMLCDPLPQPTTRPPEELGGTSAGILIHVDDVDAVVEQAVGAGATLTKEVADQLWGDRLGTITDLFGHVWLIATRIEDPTPEEIAARAEAAMARSMARGMRTVDLAGRT
jgi:PhnB protein